MDLRHLRYFLTVADTGSVTAASRILYVAQLSAFTQELYRPNWAPAGPREP